MGREMRERGPGKGLCREEGWKWESKTHRAIMTLRPLSSDAAGGGRFWGFTRGSRWSGMFIFQMFSLLSLCLFPCSSPTHRS